MAIPFALGKYQKACQSKQCWYIFRVQFFPAGNRWFHEV